MLRKLLPASVAALLLLCCSLHARAEERIEERVTLTTEDGWNLSAHYLPAGPDSPTLLLIHSQKSDLGEWKPWLPLIKRYGFGYLSMDLRGHGDSFVTPDGSTTSWRSFSPSGSDNEYNKMLRYVEAGLAFLSTNSVSGERTVLVGDVLGANLAIKAAAIHPEVAMVIAVSPVLNVNDVLSVNPLRAYGTRPLLMIGGAGQGRQYKELQLLNDIARRACGKENAAIIVEAKGFGPKLISRYNIRRVLDWIKNPRLPEIVEYSSAAASGFAPEGTETTGETQNAGTDRPAQPEDMNEEN